MAQEYGAKLLAEVQMCTLGEVLAQLRSRRQPTKRQWTGIDFLDDLVEAFAAGHQHATPRRPNQPPTPNRQHGESPRGPGSARNPPSTFQNANPRPPIIEITSTSPGSGKTELLYHLAATYLLGSDPQASTSPSPSSSPSSSIPPSTIIYLDLTSRFTPSRLLTHLRTSLSSRPFTDASAFDPDAAKSAQTEASAIAALDHIHVFQPQTSASLVATLGSLEAYILDVKSHYSGDRPLGAILIADLSAFYWEDRHDDETNSKSSSSGSTGPAMTTAGGDTALLQGRWRSIISSLHALQRTFSCPIIATNMSLLRPQRTRDGVVAPPHLPGVWNGAVDVRVLLSRQRERFEETMSAEEVLGRQRGRLNGAQGAKEASVGSGMSARSRLRVNLWRCEDWEDGVRGRVGEMGRKRWFLRMGEDGVGVEEGT